MQSVFKPLVYFWKPTPHPSTSPTLLLLHRTGGDETELVEAAAKFGDNLNLLGLRGHVLENDKLRYFARLQVGVFDEADLAFRTDELRQTVLDLATKLGFDVSKLFAIGRSNGANVAGALLQRHPGFLTGAILLRPSVPFSAITTFPAPNPTPILISSGFLDAQEPIDEANKWATLLIHNGFTVTHTRLSAGHAITLLDWAFAYAWFQDLKENGLKC
ncbi:MAG: hypothetical protein J0L94_02455 [Rhodothermia bacterium]|nr:hypothetical protein [Rhodothermia bacterium]